jgi:hypothetical protein
MCIPGLGAPARRGYPPIESRPNFDEAVRLIGSWNQLDGATDDPVERICQGNRKLGGKQVHIELPRLLRVATVHDHGAPSSIRSREEVESQAPCPTRTRQNRGAGPAPSKVDVAVAGRDRLQMLQERMFGEQELHVEFKSVEVVRVEGCDQDPAELIVVTSHFHCGRR